MLARRTGDFLALVDLLVTPFGRGVAGRGDGVRRVELRGTAAARDFVVRAFGRVAVERLAGERFAAAVGFFRETGPAAARRLAGFFSSFIVSSIFTSCFVSSRQTPGVSFGSVMGPMATRRSLETG